MNEKSRERTSFSVQPEKVSDSSSTAPPGHQLLSGETHDLVVQKEIKGTWHLSVFSPYWMINKTSLILQYNVSELNLVHNLSTSTVIIIIDSFAQGKSSNSIITHPPDMAIALFANEKVSYAISKKCLHIIFKINAKFCSIDTCEGCS